MINGFALNHDKSLQIYFYFCVMRQAKKKKKKKKQKERKKEKRLSERCSFFLAHHSLYEKGINS